MIRGPCTLTRRGNTMNFHSERIGGACQFAIFYDALNCPRHERTRVTSNFLGITEQTLRRYLSGKAEPPAPFVRLLFFNRTNGRRTARSNRTSGSDSARLIPRCAAPRPFRSVLRSALPSRFALCCCSLLLYQIKSISIDFLLLFRSLS